MPKETPKVDKVASEVNYRPPTWDEQLLGRKLDLTRIIEDTINRINEVRETMAELEQKRDAHLNERARIEMHQSNPVKKTGNQLCEAGGQAGRY